MQKLRPLEKSLVPFQKFRGRRRFGLRFLKPHEVEWIANGETLKRQTALSLKDRVRHFKRQFPGSSMNYTLLSKVYRRHKIKKRKITWKKKQNNKSEEEMKRERQKLMR